MSGFTVWVDGDSCPVGVREIIVRASGKRRVRTKFVADRPLPFPESEYCRQVIVAPGEDAADDFIAAAVTAGDIVVTRDVTLTDRVIAEGAVVLDDLGNHYDANNIAERRSIYRFMSSLRSRGIYTRAPEKKGRNPFANAFDRLLTGKTLAGGGLI